MGFVRSHREEGAQTLKPKWIAWIGLAALLILHLDFWRPQRPILYFGWLPEDMAYRLVWMFLAWLFLMFFTRYVWKEDD